MLIQFYKEGISTFGFMLVNSGNKLWQFDIEHNSLTETTIPEDRKIEYVDNTIYIPALNKKNAYRKLNKKLLDIVRPLSDIIQKTDAEKSGD